MVPMANLLSNVYLKNSIVKLFTNNDIAYQNILISFLTIVYLIRKRLFKPSLI